MTCPSDWTEKNRQNKLLSVCKDMHFLGWALGGVNSRYYRENTDTRREPFSVRQCRYLGVDLHTHTVDRTHRHTETHTGFLSPAIKTLFVCVCLCVRVCMCVGHNMAQTGQMDYSKAWEQYYKKLGKSTHTHTQVINSPVKFIFRQL